MCRHFWRDPTGERRIFDTTKDRPGTLIKRKAPRINPPYNDRPRITQRGEITARPLFVIGQDPDHGRGLFLSLSGRNSAGSAPQDISNSTD